MGNALALIQGWINESPNKITIIPRSDCLDSCDQILGISEYSVLGTLFNHTGGLIVANGLIRHFGGKNRFNMSIVEANRLANKIPTLIEGVLIVAIDIYGGLFAINIDYIGANPGSMLYLPPDSYSWFAMKIGHSDFVEWSMSNKVSMFYTDYQKLTIQPDCGFDSIMQYMPPLWSVDIQTTNLKPSLIKASKIIAIRAGYLAEISRQFS